MADDREWPEEDELPPDHRSGYVALAGRPNVGKSTLLNAWLGYPVAAVSPRPQTTRNRILGILTRPEAQVVFTDTPGLHLPRTKLGEYMVAVAEDAIRDADVVLFVVDLSQPPSPEDRHIARFLAALPQAQTILVMNKSDLASPEDVDRHRSAYGALGAFADAVDISALQGGNLETLLQKVISRLPVGPRYYPQDQLTDQQERFIAAELIREQAMRILEQEVPHALAVIVDEFKERPNGVIYISASIYTEKDSQKGIVIGRGGSMLKRIGSEARLVLERVLEQPVFVELWVKVRKNWRHNERLLRQLGYVLPKST